MTTTNFQTEKQKIEKEIEELSIERKKHYGHSSVNKYNTKIRDYKIQLSQLLSDEKFVKEEIESLWEEEIKEAKENNENGAFYDYPEQEQISIASVGLFKDKLLKSLGIEREERRK